MHYHLWVGIHTVGFPSIAGLLQLAASGACGVFSTPHPRCCSEVLLVRAIRSGNKEMERVYLPLSSLVTWAAVLACSLSICASLGVSLQPLLAVGGAGGIAAGFASQQLLLNVVAGVNIFLTRPFIAGDQVRGGVCEAGCCRGHGQLVECDAVGMACWGVGGGVVWLLLHPMGTKLLHV